VPVMCILLGRGNPPGQSIRSALVHGSILIANLPWWLRHSTLRQAPRPAGHEHPAAHHRKHQALRANGYRRGHRPRICVRWEIEQGLLVEVKVRQLRMPRNLYLLYRRREPLSHSAKAMFDLLKPRSPTTRAGATRPVQVRTMFHVKHHSKALHIKRTSRTFERRLRSLEY
jgi:hypothetical protein